MQSENNQKSQAVIPDQSDKKDEVNVEQILDDTPEAQKFIQDDYQKAQQYKKQGNHYYSQQNPQQAISKYQHALQYTLEPQMKAVLYSNISIVLMKQKKFQNAANYCQKALKNNPKHLKASVNLAQCQENLQQYEQALESCKKAQAIESTEFMKNRIKYLSVKVQQINQKRKTEVIDGLKNIGNSVLGYFGMSLDNFKLQQGQGGGYNVSFKQ